MTVNRISAATRYKKRDENGKVVDTTHDRTKDFEFQNAIESYEEFIPKSFFNPNFVKDANDASDDVDEVMHSRPCIQNYEQILSMRFKQEKKKGILTIEKALMLEPTEVFPTTLDFIIDYEITDVLNAGLMYRQTLHSSGAG